MEFKLIKTESMGRNVGWLVIKYVARQIQGTRNHIANSARFFLRK